MSDSEKSLTRAFVQFIIDPICNFIKKLSVTNKEDKEALLKMMEKLNIEVTQQKLQEKIRN